MSDEKSTPTPMRIFDPRNVIKMLAPTKLRVSIPEKYRGECKEFATMDAMSKWCESVGITFSEIMMRDNDIPHRLTYKNFASVSNAEQLFEWMLPQDELVTLDLLGTVNALAKDGYKLAQAKTLFCESPYTKSGVLKSSIAECARNAFYSCTFEKIVSETASATLCALYSFAKIPDVDKYIAYFKE
jgi:hypothetical protein